MPLIRTYLVFREGTSWELPGGYLAHTRLACGGQEMYAGHVRFAPVRGNYSVHGPYFAVALFLQRNGHGWSGNRMLSNIDAIMVWACMVW